MFEQGKQNPQTAVHHAAQRPGMRVAPLAQRLIVRAGRGIVLCCRSSPVIRRFPEMAIARIAHRDGGAPSPTALLRDGGNAHPRAHNVIRSIDQRLRGLSEHPGGDARPDPWHGADNGDVRMLALVSQRRQLGLERVQQTRQLSFGLASLPGHQLEAREHQRHVGGDGVHDPGAV